MKNWKEGFPQLLLLKITNVSFFKFYIQVNIKHKIVGKYCKSMHALSVGHKFAANTTEIQNKDKIVELYEYKTSLLS